MAISVQGRARPEFDPVPIRIASFNVLASVEPGIVSDNNIYATRTAKVDDVVASVTAGVSARSIWSRHALSFDAGTTLARGLCQDDEDTETYQASIGGHLDMGAHSRVTAMAGYSRAYEPRGSIGDTTLRGPRIAYNALKLDAEVQHTAGRLVLNAQAGLNAYRYVPYHVDDIRVDQSQRDYRSWNAGAQAGYAIVPGVATFVEGSYNQARYPNDTGPLDRDSTGWSVRGGLSFGVTRLMRGRAAIGYQSQRYDDPIFPQIKGLDFDAELEWSPTRLMTWALETRRTIQRSPLAGVAGIRQSRHGARLDYEVRRNALLWARIEFTVSEYRGLDRRQRDLSGGLGADWILGPKLRLSVQGNLQATRSSQIGRRDFDRSRMALSARYSL